MIRLSTGATALGMAVVLTAALTARQSGQSEQKPPPAQQMGGQTMSMEDMMKQCREHCQATSTSLAQTLKTAREAKQSNDPAKMRAALDQIDKPLTEMQGHMKMCTDMMEKMQKMHGQGGMMDMKGATPPIKKD